MNGFKWEFRQHYNEQYKNNMNCEIKCYIYNILIKYNSIFNIYTLKNAGLNTAQCWVNIGPNTCWVVFQPTVVLNV